MTSLVLRSCVIFLVIIVSGTWSYFTGDPNNKGKYMPEKCWAKKYICENLSGDGLGYRHNTCLFRCQCKGFRSGVCRRNRDCIEKFSEKSPYKCECRDKLNIFYRTDCDRQTVGRWF